MYVFIGVMELWLIFYSAINVDKAFDQLTKLILSKTKDDDIKYEYTNMLFIDCPFH